MKRILMPTSSAEDWRQFLAKPDRQWKAGYSAMSTAICWESSSPHLPPEIISVLNATMDPLLSDLKLLIAVPEWKVDLPGGSRASQTDVLAIARNDCGLVVLGVEAKVDEPFGPTLGEKRTAATSGQLERIRFLEDKLGCANSIDDGIRYQLLHRTVSALLAAREFHAPVAVMLVQSFSPSAMWRSDFDAFLQAVKAQHVSDEVSTIKIGVGPKLYVGWCAGDSKYTQAHP